MNRRDILKGVLLSPLLGLFKKKAPVSAEPKIREVSETTGTSSEGPWHLEVCDCEKCKKHPKPVFYKRVRGNEYKKELMKK